MDDSSGLRSRLNNLDSVVKCASDEEGHAEGGKIHIYSRPCPNFDSKAMSPSNNSQCTKKTKMLKNSTKKSTKKKKRRRNRPAEIVKRVKDRSSYRYTCSIVSKLQSYPKLQKAILFGVCSTILLYILSTFFFADWVFTEGVHSEYPKNAIINPQLNARQDALVSKRDLEIKEGLDVSGNDMISVRRRYGNMNEYLQAQKKARTVLSPKREACLRMPIQIHRSSKPFTYFSPKKKVLICLYCKDL